MITYKDSWLYPFRAYQFGNKHYFVVYQTWHERWEKMDWPMIFTHNQRVPNLCDGFANLSYCPRYDRIQSSRFTGNCGIRTLEFASWDTTPALVERATLWLRREGNLGMLVASDWTKGPTTRALQRFDEWEYGPAIPNPNMGALTPDAGEVHPIHLMWRDISKLDASEVDSWKSVPIPSEPEKSSPPAGIFEGTSDSTIAISPLPSSGQAEVSSARWSRSPRTAESRPFRFSEASRASRRS